MRKLIPLLVCLLLLCGCSKEEEVYVPPAPPLHEQADSFQNDIVSMNSITPVSAFESVGDEVHLFPFYDSDKYINMKLVLVSDNGFWNTLLESYEGTDNLQTFEKYSLITTPSGNTMVMLPYDEDYNLLIESSQLPSGYVKATADKLCK